MQCRSLAAMPARGTQLSIWCKYLCSVMIDYSTTNKPVYSCVWDGPASINRTLADEYVIADAAGLGKTMPQRLRTPQRPGKLSAAALRPTSSIINESPTHNEYSRRERGLGKPCFTMDMGPGIDQNNSSGSLQAFGKDASGHLVSNSAFSTEENASPNASLKAFNRPWDISTS